MQATNPLIMKFQAWFRRHLTGYQLLQLIVYVILFVVLVDFIIDHPDDLAPWRFFGTVLALTMVLVLNILWTEVNISRHGWDWAVLTVCGLLLFAAVWMGQLFNAIFLFFMLCSQASIALGVWPAGIIFCLANMVAWLALFRTLNDSNSAMISFGMSLSMGILFMLLISILLERYSQQTARVEKLLTELRQANASLEAASRKEKELAIAQERVRLARDIHDGLGHHLTVLSIQLQAAGKLVERNPQAAAESIQLCRTEAQAALDEVRHSVGVMRQSPVDSRPLPETLSALVTDFEQATGLQASFEQSGIEAELPSLAHQVLYRVVQEGLTNAQKHGHGITHIWVQLEYQVGAVRLRVRDDGQIFETVPSDQAGYGLLGLRERVDQLGGSMHSGLAEAQGFEIEVFIPLTEAGHD